MAFQFPYMTEALNGRGRWQTKHNKHPSCCGGQKFQLMSHLPPKPDFGTPPPGRYPPDYRHYGRSPAPPPDRCRERGVYLPRSPPRSRPPGDSYIAPRLADSYISSRHSMDSYVASYDRRDDDRYRDVYRESPREREWRERGHPPPDYRHRPREPSRERGRWDREGEIERMRRWDDRGRRDVSLSRRRSREDERRYGRDRVREVEPERKWIPRPSKSPPRRMGMCS